MKFLSSAELSRLTNKELLEYKQNLEQYYYEIEDLIHKFTVAYKMTTRKLVNRVAALEIEISKCETDRLTSGTYNYNILNIQ